MKAVIADLPDRYASQVTVHELPDGVGWTSLLTAYGRAQERLEAEPLFSDPLAKEFIAAAIGAELPASARLPRLGPARDDGSSALWDGFRFYFTQRTPFYDRHVLQAVGAGCRQAVVLGAGLDSRAFRLGLPPEVTVFEVDQAAVLNFKDRVLADRGAVPTCRRVPLAADVRRGLRAPLTAAGFDPGLPALWLQEGLLMYFTRQEADQLQTEVTALSAPGSRLATEYFSRRWTNADVGYDTLDEQERAAWDLLMNSFRYGPVDDDPDDWLASHGWKTLEVTTVRDEGHRAGRRVPPEFARPGATQVWLVSGIVS
jgi:methyltransferase (TIGR00027 family)